MIIIGRAVVTFPVGRALFGEWCHGEHLPDAVRVLGSRYLERTGSGQVFVLLRLLID
jgi:hypothetical protein